MKKKNTLILTSLLLVVSILVIYGNWSRALDERGFYFRGYRSGLHSKTKSIYDKEGFKIDGYNKRGFDKDKYDREGYRYGYDRDGYIGKYDRDGYNKEGIDEKGFNRKGYDKKGYDKKGFNIFGINEDGRNKNGIRIFIKNMKYQNIISDKSEYQMDAHLTGLLSRVKRLKNNVNKKLYNEVKMPSKKEYETKKEYEIRKKIYNYETKKRDLIAKEWNGNDIMISNYILQKEPLSSYDPETETMSFKVKKWHKISEVENKSGYGNYFYIIKEKKYFDIQGIYLKIKIPKSLYKKYYYSEKGEFKAKIVFTLVNDFSKIVSESSEYSSSMTFGKTINTTKKDSSLHAIPKYVEIDYNGSTIATKNY